MRLAALALALAACSAPLSPAPQRPAFVPTSPRKGAVVRIERRRAPDPPSPPVAWPRIGW